MEKGRERENREIQARDKGLIKFCWSLSGFKAFHTDKAERVMITMIARLVEYVSLKDNMYCN